MGSIRPSAQEHRVPGGPPGGPLDTRDDTNQRRHDTTTTGPVTIGSRTAGPVPPVLHGRERELQRLGE
ncbi:hypothetical protein ACFQ07_15745, partial [Actinomadura adrarensis]